LEQFKEQGIPCQVLAVGRVSLVAAIPWVGMHQDHKLEQQRHQVQLEDMDLVRQDSIVAVRDFPKAVMFP
jgi:hypothetical protein